MEQTHNTVQKHKSHRKSKISVEFLVQVNIYVIPYRRHVSKLRAVRFQNKKVQCQYFCILFE